MTAFVTFIKTYAVWIYILSGIGFLVALKMLFDARQLARTTLFSLDQERAGEQYYRGIALIIILILLICAVSGINLFISPALPAPEPPIVRVASPTFVITIPINTQVAPTIPSVATKPLETISISNPSPVATRTPTKPPAPTAPTATVFILPAPLVKGPIPNGGAWTGENQANNNLVFRWEWICDQCVLGPNDVFFLLVSWTNKNTGASDNLGGTTRESFLSLGTMVRGSNKEVWHQAKEDSYAWYVQVRRGDQALTPQSETWKFFWH
ncbi:MAG: hypothetical protein HY257_06700 [Chloroflexi bacterium]|nr:hypothetical protein [Chloroflexota bacterium]